MPPTPGHSHATQAPGRGCGPQFGRPLGARGELAKHSPPSSSLHLAQSQPGQLQRLYVAEQNLSSVVEDAEGFLVPPMFEWSISGSTVCAAIAESSESGVTAQSSSCKCAMPATSNCVYNPLQFLALLESEKFICMNFPAL